MDASVLAQKMLEWEELKRRLDVLEGHIQDAVMAIGKTQTVGHVRATYSGGRKTYNYEVAVRSAEIPEDDWVTKTTVDFKATCDRAMIIVGDALITQSPPSVTMKLLE